MVRGGEPNRMISTLKLAYRQARMAWDAEMAAQDRGQGNLGQLAIGITIAAIIIVSVAIPVINDQVASANVSGTTATILGLITLFLALLLFVAVASPIMNRT